MTHDELLKKVETDQEITKFLTKGLMQGDIAINIARQHWFQSNALRAVVELHKPSGEGLGYAAYCHQCMFNHGSGEIKNHAYPCPTIQAIEKELSNG